MDGHVIARIKYALTNKHNIHPKLDLQIPVYYPPPQTSANKKMRTNSVAFLLEDAHDLVMFDAQDGGWRRRPGPS